MLCQNASRLVGDPRARCLRESKGEQIKAIDPAGKLYGGVLHEYPRGVETIEKVGAIFERLAEEGVTEPSLAKLRGGNLMRVLGRVSPDRPGQS